MGRRGNTNPCNKSEGEGADRREKRERVREISGIRYRKQYAFASRQSKERVCATALLYWPLQPVLLRKTGKAFLPLKRFFYGPVKEITDDSVVSGYRAWGASGSQIKQMFSLWLETSTVFNPLSFLISLLCLLCCFPVFYIWIKGIGLEFHTIQCLSQHVFWKQSFS